MIKDLGLIGRFKYYWYIYLLEDIRKKRVKLTANEGNINGKLRRLLSPKQAVTTP